MDLTNLLSQTNLLKKSIMITISWWSPHHTKRKFYYTQRKRSQSPRNLMAHYTKIHKIPGSTWAKEVLHSQDWYENFLWKLSNNIWIFQMEQFFDLNQVSTLQKVTIASLYLETDQFIWYQWLCDHKKDAIISWYIFTE